MSIEKNTQTLKNKTLSLYIHFPWCIRKCPYCDFNSHVARQGIPEKEYITALLNDLDQNLATEALRLKEKSITTIYMGGGTPSLFSPESIDSLLQGVAKRLNLAPNIEISLEANPGTVLEKYLKGYIQAGVNRLSLGIQSFDDEKLKALGRIHTGHESKQAIHNALQAGFKNFNLDLMHGLPNQTPDEALSDLHTALSFAPPHLSWYQLTLEPNTHFYKRPPILPKDDTIWEIQDLGQNLLAQKGYTHYEISAYCQPAHECQHNVNYWQFGDYLGIGAGAHSKITLENLSQQIRMVKASHPRLYMDPNHPFISEQNPIKTDELPFEFMLNALRLHKPITQSQFTRQTGLPISTLQTTLQQAQDSDLINWDGNTLTTTDTGHRFLNDLITLFLPAE